MSKVLTLTYGVVTYAIFFGTFCYMVGFLGGWVVPKSINTGEQGGVVSSILVNVGILAVFAVQHTVMARLKFKVWWTTVIPKQVERSTFVLITSLILIALVWQWRPLTTTIWNVGGVGGTMLTALSLLGWGIVLYATFLINHFDLFGLRQVVLYAQDKEYTPVEFQMKSLYRWVRHPLMTGFLIAFWATPHMTTGHLLFAGVVTAYILVGTQIEERTLLALHGDAYQQYKDRVSGLIPLKGIAPAGWTPTPSQSEG